MIKTNPFIGTLFGHTVRLEIFFDLGIHTDEIESRTEVITEYVRNQLIPQDEDEDEFNKWWNSLNEPHIAVKSKKGAAKMAWLKAVKSK